MMPRQTRRPYIDAMVAQAAGFAVLAALSPTALLVIAVYLGSARPGRTGSY